MVRTLHSGIKRLKYIVETCSEFQRILFQFAYEHQSIRSTFYQLRYFSQITLDLIPQNGAGAMQRIAVVFNGQLSRGGSLRGSNTRRRCICAGHTYDKTQRWRLAIMYLRIFSRTTTFILYRPCGILAHVAVTVKERKEKRVKLIYHCIPE